MKEVHVVVPAGIDDPGRPSGGNLFDRRLCDELPAWGWAVREVHVTGDWPTPIATDLETFGAQLKAIADGSMVLVDGLIASGAAQLVAAAERLRVVVLVHMPDATEQVEAEVLRAAAGVITTSQWSRDDVIARHSVRPEQVWTAIPGVDQAPVAAGSPSGRSLLVVGPVTPAKGHDVLLAALTEIADLDWHCTCAGALDLEPGFAAMLRSIADGAGIADRLEFTGPLALTSLDQLRSRTDLAISASRREAYGMAVAEGLAVGVPVIATDVGGHREAVGKATDGSVPGMLVPTGDVDRLAAGLRQWLSNPATRDQWRASARQRRHALTSWSETARTVSSVLDEIHREPGTPPAPI